MAGVTLRGVTKRFPDIEIDTVDGDGFDEALGDAAERDACHQRGTAKGRNSSTTRE